MAIVENLQRKDLNPLEKAASFQQYLERYGVHPGRAGRAAEDRPLDDRQPDPAARAARGHSAGASAQAAITQGHARALLPLGDEREQVAFCRKIQAESLSVRATEELVQRALHSDDHESLSVVGSDAAPRAKSAKRGGGHTGALEHELRTALGTKVEIKQRAAGRGHIVIHFANSDEFDRLRDHLGGKVRSKAG